MWKTLAWLFLGMGVLCGLLLLLAPLMIRTQQWLMSLMGEPFEPHPDWRRRSTIGVVVIWLVMCLLLLWAALSHRAEVNRAGSAATVSEP